MNTQRWELNLVQKLKLMTIIRGVENSNRRMNFIILTKGNFRKIRLELKVVTERKQCHFYLIFFSEAKSKYLNKISLKNCTISVILFHLKKKRITWFSKLNHVQCEILRWKYTIARVLCSNKNSPWAKVGSHYHSGGRKWECYLKQYL